MPHESPPFSLLAKRELVQRIVTSDSFHRSERLSSFLQHICELEMEGRGSELNEKTIGHSVFRLPADYDPSTDGIVRSHASRLRRKLEMYYQREGSEEKTRIVIPRGGYIPRFVQVESCSSKTQEQESFAHVHSDPTPQNILETPLLHSETPGKHQRSPWRLLILIGFIGIAVAASVLWIRTKQHAYEPRFWTKIFTKERPTILVPGDSGVVVWQELQHRNLTLAEYLSPAYARQITGLPEQQERIALTLLGRRYTSMVDLEIIEKLARMANAFGTDPLIRYARDVRPNDLKHSNVVLIGSNETNPWNQMFQGNQNFILNKDQARSIYLIENRHPAPQEAMRWISDPEDPLHTVFCKVSYLTNSSAEGNVLILEGTSMAGTECAWEFAANPERMQRFLQIAGWRQSQPPHFEVLLRTSNLAGDSSASSIVAWRISPP